jgi:alkanesulfonate monooxygenase SsuD/methylene tetrahydromethanopterin reductase-like flavin-dependent oxidoreductase (luciferase family)
MDIGIGLDPTLGLSFDEQAVISKESAQLGYQSIWTPENTAEDSFLVCAQRWQATRDVVPGGVVAMSAGTMSKLTGGKFTLGIGTGGADMPPYRRTWDIKGTSSTALMRDYLTILRGLLAGDTVNYEGRLTINPPQRTPVYLAALGPEMCRLGGELADGVSLNWCSAERVAWSRDRIAEGAERSGRDPSEVKVAEYIRVCVDDDVDVARRSFTRSMMGYALGQLGARPRSYRAHFNGMGFEKELAHVDELRAAKAPQDEVVDAFPEALLKAVGYYGPAAGAAAHVSKLAEGLDNAIVRVVAARPGIEATRAVMQACRPANWAAK